MSHRILWNLHNQMYTENKWCDVPCKFWSSGWTTPCSTLSAWILHSLNICRSWAEGLPWFPLRWNKCGNVISTFWQLCSFLLLRFALKRDRCRISICRWHRVSEHRLSRPDVFIRRGSSKIHYPCFSWKLSLPSEFSWGWVWSRFRPLQASRGRVFLPC